MTKKPLPTLSSSSSSFPWLLLLIFLLFSGFATSLNGGQIVSVWQHHHDFNEHELEDEHEHGTALKAALDGKIHLVWKNSNRVIWSFSSGPPIYTSYQAPPSQHATTTVRNQNNFHIECGDDWNLYAHHQTLGIHNLSISIEDFIKGTPYTLEDGAVTVGSKKTTVFEVDLRTGKLIHTYPSSSSSSSSSSSLSPAAQHHPVKLMRLQIMRTDYTLKSFVPSSHKESWNMTVAEIGAALLCPDVDQPVGESLLTLKVKNSHEIISDIALPLRCQTKVPVFRYKNHVLFEFPSIEMLPGKAVLPEHASRPMLREQTNDDGDYSSLEDEHDSILSKSNLFDWSTALSLALFIGIVVGIVIYHHAPMIIGKVWLFNEQTRNSNSRASPSKRKKSRKSEKGKKELSENGDDSEDVSGLDLNKLFYCGADGRRIGKLIVSNKEIAKGSNGTVVLEGMYEGRSVAVKRLVRAHHDAAVKEIQNLIASDRHPNIVRWYGVECDQDFVYLSLERCTCSLDDLVQIYLNSSQNSASTSDHAMGSITDYNVHLESVKNIMPDVILRKPNGYPSPLSLKLMRDMVSGLVHLHQLGIIHRDLKPQNVLIVNEISLCAKLSDMGISKRLDGNMSSLAPHATGKIAYPSCGSSGWQAPEQLLQEQRQTRAVDLFSLGCVLFFCITGGKHPFGESLKRDMNIVENKMDLILVESMPEAFDLISRLLSANPELRPKASEVLHHPLFWNSEKRLSFLRDTSDRVELEDRKPESALLKELESIAPIALGGKWNVKMDKEFMMNIGQYRRYKFDSIRDLLRVMRNKLNHYRELPKEIQELLGSVPDGYNDYFGSRFPRLLTEVYKVISRNCKEEKCFQQYFETKVE
ncbi:hypothetical protein G4B88_006956 [Cannabis sativa]|uniref:non-specific serine/threonine protein kinase n=1 Tax=Cannabis sativa TaxID=3483 RepID=A0A7J6G3Z7_CANSA|nr:hypothetical protein G4B88_006956 [Cannabis sativa]